MPHHHTLHAAQHSRHTLQLLGIMVLCTFCACGQAPEAGPDVAAAAAHGASDELALAAQPQNPTPQDDIVADAGPNRWAYSGDTVQLDGSRTRYDGNLSLAFHWRQLEGPVVELQDAGQVEMRFTAPDVDGGDTVKLRLTVDDGRRSATDDVFVHMLEPPPLRPTIQVRPGREIGAGQLVTLDGRRSSAAAGRELTYRWAQVSGPALDLGIVDTAVTSFTAPFVNDSVVLGLTVTAGPLSASTTVRIDVVCNADNGPCQDSAAAGDADSTAEAEPPGTSGPADTTPVAPAPPPTPQAGSAATAPPQAPQPGPAVLSFTVVDADTDTALAGFDPLPDNAVLRFGPALTANIRANLDSHTPERVEFALYRDGLLLHTQVEFLPPYTLFGNTAGDYDPWPDGGPWPGKYTLTATPYSSTTAGSALTQKFAVVRHGDCDTADCADAPPCDGSAPCDGPTGQDFDPSGSPISNFTLMWAELNQAVPAFDPLTDGAVVPLSEVGSALSVRANLSTEPGSVFFELREDGDLIWTRTENVPPFALFGAYGVLYRAWPYGGPRPGSHYEVVATPYERNGAHGAAAVSATVAFTVASDIPLDDCSTADDCDDGLFCNGAESCIAGGCQDGLAPCSPEQACDEVAQQCLEPATISSLTLIDADSDQPLPAFDPLNSGTELDLDELDMALNVRANVTREPGSVRFELRENGMLIWTQIENNQPFALFGDSGSDYFVWPNGGPAAGLAYDIVATPYEFDGAAGDAGSATLLSVSFIGGPTDSGCTTNAECDDGLFCNGLESCSSGFCLAGDPPCEASPCDEAAGSCAPLCDGAADCDDGVFCNGSESCDDGACVSSGSPCGPGEFCVEAMASCEISSWVPPLGIPHPGFGVEEVAAPYDAANPLHYYVDNTHPQATDGSNPNGSPTLPRRRVPLNLPAGAVVEVRGGPYDYHNLAGKLVMSGDGTSAAPIFIRGASAQDRPRFAEHINIAGSHLILENLRFENHGFDLRPVLGDFHHLTIRYCEFAGSGTYAGGGVIQMRGDPAPIHDVVIYANDFYDNGDDGPQAPDPGRHSVEVGHSAEHVWILDNTIRDSGEDAVQINFWGSLPTKVPSRHVYVGRNIMHGDRENALDVKVAYDVVVSENTMYDYHRTSSSNGEAIVIHSGQTTGEHTRPEHVWVIFNEVFDADWGVTVTGGADIFAVGNLFRDNQHTSGSYDPASVYAGGTGFHARNCGPVHVFNNSLWNNDSHITLANVQLEGRGNILSRLSEPQAFHLNVINGAGAVALDFDTYYNDGDSIRLRWSGQNYFGLSSFFAGTGQEADGVEADPLFASPANGDFTVPPGSPAPFVDGSHPLFAEFEARFGVSIAPEVIGIVRRN